MQGKIPRKKNELRVLFLCSGNSLESVASDKTGGADSTHDFELTSVQLNASASLTSQLSVSVYLITFPSFVFPLANFPTRRHDAGCYNMLKTGDCRTSLLSEEEYLARIARDLVPAADVTPDRSCVPFLMTPPDE